jgi:Protein of unknown function (DUF2934)
MLASRRRREVFMINRDNGQPPNPEEKDMPRDKSPTSTAPRKRAPRKTLAIRKAEPTFTNFVGPEERAALIAEAAYFRAERRGFLPGHETEDWLAAEEEVDARLLRSDSAPHV